MRLLRRLGAWLNGKLNIVATEEESRYFAELDRELDERRRRG